jgi:hypothetical protein
MRIKQFLPTWKAKEMKAAAMTTARKTRAKTICLNVTFVSILHLNRL